MDTGDEGFDNDVGGVQAFKVESDEDDLDLNIPPTSGNQYLRRVRMEASGCPKVVVANLDTKAFREKQTVHVKQWIGDHHPAPCGFAPSVKWQNMQVANFAEQRQKLARYKAKRKKLKVTKLPTVPHSNDVEAWCRLCFGRLKPPGRQGHADDDSRMSMQTAGPVQINQTEPSPQSIADMSTDSIDTSEIKDTTMATDLADSADVKHDMNNSPEFPIHEGILPLVSFMVAMDQMTVINVLEYHINWFEVTGFTEKQGYWFYSLLVCLDKPLTPDACALLRDLARACSRLRASLDNSTDARVIPLNLFICLIARYFDQSDLMDNIT